ncbi:uncharacterized protein LOC135348401 isoform X2 [Halichondria panicea]|uniref:uncharacterized protein LOC135348401 isoform X2 n=1 Tax=Halichondria panicea TaxID=6063 RepID=UPI00312B6147
MNVLIMQLKVNLLLIFCTSAYGELAKIEAPFVYNAYLNQPDNGVFVCLVRNGGSARWIVDGQQADSVPILSREITVTYDLNQVPGYITATITIPATVVNSNGVTCKCRRYTSIGFVEAYETAKFYVQGILQMSSNYTVARYNKSHNRVSWTEPFSLNITAVQQDIFGYTICTDGLTAIEQLQCMNTTTAEIILPKYCVDVNYLTVGAWNIVGESNTVLFAVERETTGENTSLSEAIAEISFSGNETEINIIFNDSELELCLCVFQVTIFQLTSNSIVFKGFIYSIYEYLTIVCNLPHNETFLANVSCSDNKIEHSNIPFSVIGGCSGGAVCCIIFITVTLAVLFKKRRRKSKKTFEVSNCEAYSIVLNMRKNEAYNEICIANHSQIIATEPHLYDVIENAQGSPTLPTEPLYAEIRV